MPNDARPSRKRQKLIIDEELEETTKPRWYVFPPKESRLLSVGTNIRFKQGASTFRTGEVVEANATTQCVFVKEEECDVRRLKLDKREQKRALSLGVTELPTVIITSETTHFRQLVGYVLPDDKVLEIGCSTGEMSKLILQSQCQSYVGVDTSPEMVQRCKDLLSSLKGENPISEKIHLTVVDALVDPTTAKKQATVFGNPSVVFVDINGNRENISVRRMITWAQQSLNPRLLIVKSRELFSMIQFSDCEINQATGFVKGGDDWFCQHRQKLALPRHPLRAALMMSPDCPETPICRYHNYHKNGCKRDNCNLDHTHCHACQRKGHVARDCALFSGGV